MANVKLKDFVSAENELDGSEYAYISQSEKTRKTTIQKIKEFILGIGILNTTSKTIIGAINENDESIGDLTTLKTTDKTSLVNAVNENTTSLSEKANDTDNSRTTTNKTVTGAINELNTNKANIDSTMYYKDFGATSTDLNTIVATGIYRCGKWTNYPSDNPDGQGIVEIYKLNVGWERQVFISPHFNMRWERVRINSVWDVWKQVALIETTTLTLLNGWTNQIGDTRIFKNGNMVTINAVLTGGVCTNGTGIANIPLGFRPSSTKYAMIRTCSTNWIYNNDGHVVINTNGDIVFDASVINNTRLVLNITYGI
jgi:hypothetical protein